MVGPQAIPAKFLRQKNPIVSPMPRSSPPCCQGALRPLRSYPRIEQISHYPFYACFRRASSDKSHGNSGSGQIH